MRTRLDNIFNFLNEHRRFNHYVQERYYENYLGNRKTSFDRLYALLYHIANTQTQPKIDKLAQFYQSLKCNQPLLENFSGFITFLNPQNNILYNYHAVYKGMCLQPGWGNKTSALFTKILYQLHNGNFSNNLRLWEDAPADIQEDDELKLPVDSVTTYIFYILDPAKNWNFASINEFLNKKYSPKEIEIWDDLWFWGFITQKGNGSNRKVEWNANKY